MKEKTTHIIANSKQGAKNQTAFIISIRLLFWSLNGGWWVVKNWAPLLLLLAAHSSHEERTFWFNSLSSVVSSSWHLTVEESLVCRGQGCCGRSMRWCSTYWHQEAGFLTTLELLCSVNVQFCTLSLLRAQHWIISIIFIFSANGKGLIWLQNQKCYLFCLQCIIWLLQQIHTYLPSTYSHSQWLFYEFVSKITNKLVKQSLRVTVYTFLTPNCKAKMCLGGIQKDVRF